MKGRRDRWAAWVDEVAPALVLFARQWTASHADAEDVVQEAFARFWRSGRHRARDANADLTYGLLAILHDDPEKPDHIETIEKTIRDLIDGGEHRKFYL